MSGQELGKLTRAEKLLIQRRRVGETQAQAAARHGVSYTRYSAWERGKETSGLPNVTIGKLKPHEYCLLYRQRCNFTQERVANEMGICRWWLNKMETGAAPCGDLIEYWEC